MIIRIGMVEGEREKARKLFPSERAMSYVFEVRQLGSP